MLYYILKVLLCIYSKKRRKKKGFYKRIFFLKKKGEGLINIVYMITKNYKRMKVKLNY